jgi:ABC-type amino acid transport substrate-binding protein
MTGSPKALGAALILLLALVPPATAQEDLSRYPPDIRRIKERGTLIVGMYHKDVVPFMFHDSQGNFIGHEVQLAKDMAEALGVEVTFDRSPQTFNEIVDLVAAEKADLAISLISRTLIRAQKVAFSDPYITLKPNLLMNRLTVSKFAVDLEDPVESLRSLEVRIAEKKGTSYVNIARNLFPRAEVIEYPEWDDAMTAVFRGEADAALRDEIGVKNYIGSFPEQSIQLQMITLEDEKYADPLAVAVPGGSLQLLQWVNLFLKQNGITGTGDNLLKQYAKYYE